MSEDTQAALAEAVEAHTAARIALATGEDVDTVAAHDQTRRAAEEAARAHLEEVDPGYPTRYPAGVHPADRAVAPGLKAAYDEALEARHADPGNTAKAARAAEAGEAYAAARTAQRVAEGRWGTQAHVVGEG